MKTTMVGIPKMQIVYEQIKCEPSENGDRETWSIEVNGDVVAYAKGDSRGYYLYDTEGFHLFDNEKAHHVNGCFHTFEIYWYKKNNPYYDDLFEEFKRLCMHEVKSYKEKDEKALTLARFQLLFKEIGFVYGFLEKDEVQIGSKRMVSIDKIPVKGEPLHEDQITIWRKSITHLQNIPRGGVTITRHIGELFYVPHNERYYMATSVSKNPKKSGSGSMFYAMPEDFTVEYHDVYVPEKEL